MSAASLSRDASDSCANFGEPGELHPLDVGDLLPRSRFFTSRAGERFVSAQTKGLWRDTGAEFFQEACHIMKGHRRVLTVGWR